MQIPLLEINRKTEAIWAAAWRDQDAMFDANEMGKLEIVQHVTKTEASK